MRDGWREATLGSVAKIVNGGTPDTKVPEYWDGGIAWLTPKDMGKATEVYVGSTGRTLSAAGVRDGSARTVPPGSVILSTRAPIGHLAINTVPMAFNQGCRGLIPGDDLLAKYLFFFLVANVELLNELGTGTTFKELSAGALAAVVIPVPPLAEQERIVAILDEAFEAIATATSNAEKNLANARELFRRLVEAVFSSGGLDFIDQPLGDVCEVLDSRRKPITKADRISGSYPYYGASGVVDFVDHYLFDEPLVLLGEDGARWEAGEKSAFVVSERCWVNNHAHVLRPKRSLLLDDWLVLYLNSADLMPYISGVTVPKLNQARMRAIPIPVPPLSTQNRELDRVVLIQQSTATLIEHCTCKVAALAELKQSLLARALSGELTASVPAAAVLAPANDNAFATPEHVANIIAFAHQRHESAGRQNTFGRVKAQKNLHLVESVGGVELGRQPWKDAAGPNDFPHMLRAEAWAKERGFFEFRQRSDGGYDFKKLTNYAAMMAAAKLALAPIKTEVARVTGLLTPLDSGGAEVLATVHAAWNNLILDGAESTDDAIVREARDDWHASKLKIAEAKFRDAIKLIRKKGIVPDGSGKRVAGQLKLL